MREKEKTLIVAQEKGAVMLQEITASTAKAEKKKAEVQQVKDTLGSEAAVIAQQKDAVEEDLLAAKPALDDAENALKAITAKDIGLLKQLKQPPDLVKRVFDMVLILFQKEIVPSQGETVTTKRGDVLQLVGSWQFSLPMMADIGSCRAREVQQGRDQRRDGRAALPVPRAADMTPEDARKVASALAGLCTWARAMALYVGIAKVVKPKMEALKMAEQAQVGQREARQGAGRARPGAVGARRDAAQFDEALANKQALQEDADACTRRWRPPTG